MSNKLILILVILAIFQRTHTLTSHKDDEDINPFAEAASAILKEQNVQNIGSMVSSFMEHGGAEKIGNLLGNFNSEDAGNIIQGIGSMMTGGGDGGGGHDAGNQGGINPALVGAALNMLGSLGNQQETGRKNSDNGFDMGDILSLVSTFMPNQGGQNNGGGGGFMELLPTIVNTLSSFTGPEADERARTHVGHASMMPPFLERIHIYFDHFIHSDMGKHFINLLGAEKIFKVFTDENGRFDYNKFGDMLENLSFRRHWIRIATDRIISLIQLVADPKVQKQYIATAPLLINSFLQSNNFPKNAMLDLNRPTETISAMINFVAKKYIGIKINSKMYVKPAVTYIQELYQTTQSREFLKYPKQVSDKLADTINLELIEPLARVNRAYRFAKSVPACDKYVFCLVNEDNQNEIASLPELKKVLYKGSSLVAGWFLSSHTNTQFWTMYDIVTGSHRCKDYYMDKCHDFHIEETKVTTEYIHNEL